MKLDKLVAVSGGINGVFKMAANRSNGLIVEDLDTGKHKFASVRRNQFTPLESIGIYTDDGDSVELAVVFKKILEQLEDNPPIDPKSTKEELHEYFMDVLPNHDQTRVYPRDIRRVIKWFTFLNERGFLTEQEEEVTEETTTTEES